MSPILATLLVLFVGALLSLLSAPRPRLVSSVGAASAILGCAYGLWFSVLALRSGNAEALSLAWGVPNAAISLALDPLSAFFLCPLFLLGALAACYGRIYLAEHAPDRSLSVAWAAFNMMLAGMVLVLLARHAILFLFAWEVMSLSAYLLVSFDHQEAGVRRASFVYLIATHVGVGCLLSLFLLLGSHAHSFEFAAIASAPATSMGFSTLLFSLALLGFGAKAGLFPLHVWLPEAHAAAPTHVSALMSGVLIKMGIYGILRIVLLLGGPRPYWGAMLMVLGIAGGAIGIGCSLYQRDIKRILAYSSVENIGLVLLCIGVAFFGVSSGRASIAALGMVGGLLHVWNHAVMKGMMFLGAGSVAHRCHSKDIEQLGGLYRRMPRTSSVLVLGAVAMAGLPPLNGFVSEWLLYSGMMRGALSGEGRYAVALVAATAAVSLIGAMAALSFARLVGVALLGAARSKRAEAATEVSSWMTLPMQVLALAALVLALAPDMVVALFRSTLTQLLGEATSALVVSPDLQRIGTFNRVILGALVLAGTIAALLQSKGRSRQQETWGCGYTAPTARIQYGGRAFSELFTSGMLPRAFGPRLTKRLPSGLFPSVARLEASTADPVTRSVYEPFFERWAERFSRLRFMQQGILQVYVLYILVTLLLALSWAVSMADMTPWQR